MSDQKRRRLSLGDIIRKMNEEAQKSPPSNTHSEKISVADDRSTGNQPHVHRPGYLRSSSAKLPAQPHFGQPSLTQPQTSGVSEKKLAQTATAVEQKPSPVEKRGPVSHTEHPDTHPEAVQIAPLTAGAYEEAEEEEFDFFKYVNIILRRKAIVTFVTVIMAIFTVFNFLNAPKYYIAKARLLFRIQTNKIIEDAHSVRLFIAKEQILNTHLELLKSRSVLEQVEQNLHGEIESEKIAGGLGIKQGETNGEKNSVIELSFKHPKAQTAADVVNNLCKTYIDYSRGVNTQEQTRLIVKLETQIEKLEKELAERENALRYFKEKNRMVQLSSEANLAVKKLSSMELALQQTQLDLLSSKEKLNTLKAQIGRQEVNIVQSMTYKNPYQEKISELELQLNTLSAEYSDDHYKIKTITQQIEKLKQAMQSVIANEAATQTFIKNPIRESLLQTLVNQSIEISALETKRTAQEQIIEKLNVELKELPSLEQRYAHLQRETESLVQTLRMLKTKYEETKIQRDAQESDLKIFELAEVPENAISSKSMSSILIGIIVGIILGIAIAFVIEYLDQTVKEPAEVEKSLDLSLLGVVPLIETESAIIENTEMLAKSVLEPFRALRANLKHLTSKGNKRVLMLCSAVKGEGKTTLAVNLAITFALDGKRVVIIDADLRRPQVHHYLNLSKENGFSDYLLGKKEIDSILKDSHHDNLKVITSGERPNNPAELLGTPQFDRMLEEIRAYGDLIIFDSPALLPVSDSITMAPKMDGCIMVVRTMWTPQKAAKQAKSQITRIGSKIMGGVLNGVSQSHGYYPYYYGYYGYKYSYYEDETPEKFSFRRFALKTEEKIKQSFTEMTTAAPHTIAGLLAFGGYLCRKKTFWILSLTFITLIAAGIIYKPKWTGEQNRSLVQRISPVQTSSSQAPVSKNISPIRIETRSRDDIQPGNRQEASFDVQSPMSFQPAATHSFLSSYKDSLAAWIQALNNHDTNRLLSFYDQSRFKFPGGTYRQWVDHVKNRLIPHTGESFIAVEEMKASVYQRKFVKTELVSRLSDGTTEIEEIRTMIWAPTGSRWRIIGQKNRHR
ncbi:MAG: GumC family protein [Fibrobacterota bacterium]